MIILGPQEYKAKVRSARRVHAAHVGRRLWPRSWLRPFKGAQSDRLSHPFISSSSLGLLLPQGQCIGILDEVRREGK